MPTAGPAWRRPSSPSCRCSAYTGGPSLGCPGRLSWTARRAEVGELLDQIRSVARRQGNTFMLLTADGVEAMGRLRRGDLREARPSLERLLADAREHGDPFGEVFSAMSLANLELDEGHRDAARRLLDESRVRLEHSARGRLEAMDL